jgi:hypothetical protein
MKKILVHILFVAVLNQTFSLSLILLHYNWTEAKIQTEICSKAHNASFQCQGICDLLHQLTHTKEQEKKQ